VIPAHRGGADRLRVLHMVGNLHYGGAERLLFEALRFSDASSIENHVLTLQFVGRFGEGLERYARMHEAPPMSRFSMLRPRSLARVIARIAPDVVHTHSGVWYKGSLAARMARVPWLVHTDHGRANPDPWLSRRLDAAASGRTDVVIAVSETVAEQLRRRVVRRPESVHVVPNGVDVDAFAPGRGDDRVRRELRLGPDTAVIGSVGRLEPIKGYEVMVDAFAALRRDWEGEEPCLVIAGDGSERPALEARARAAGIADRVRWLGWRDDVHHLHATFSLFTMSSHSEGTSISLLEGMSAGLCPVVTDVGGNRAVLGDALAHRLVVPNDAEALAAAWRTALRNPDRMRADAVEARRRVVEGFSLASMVRRYESFYRREGAAR
jgi:glycosyltransferase involved in cell wall biosynthesis